MNRRNQLLVLCGVALAVRLVVAGWWQTRIEGAFAFEDSQSYWELATRLAEGKTYQWGGPEGQVFRTPGYPWLLSGVIRLAGTEQGGVWAARGFSAMCGTLAVLALYVLGRCTVGHVPAMLAGWWMAVSPEPVSAGVLILGEAPFGPLMLMQLICVANAGKKIADRAAWWPIILWSIAAGLSAAAASLMRPSWLLFTPLLTVLAFVFIKPRKQTLCVGCVMLAALCAGMFPWWMRNYQVTGHFVPTTLQVGASLYDGLNPIASGASNFEPVNRASAQFRHNWLAHGRQIDAQYELALNRHLFHLGRNWALAHPGETLQLAAIKFQRTWNLWPNEPGLRSWPIRLTVCVAYLVVISGTALAGWKLWRTSLLPLDQPAGWMAGLLVLPAVYFSLLHVVFVGSIRYRQPALGPMALLAAWAWWTYWQERKQLLLRGS